MPLDKSEMRDAAGRSEGPGRADFPPIVPASMPTAALHPGLPASRPANGHSQCIANQEEADALPGRHFPPDIGRRVHPGVLRETKNRSLCDARPAEEYVPVPTA